jgi:rRNA pseudouridine-1189 N-methylase Emg1 (Nep1/Mra1 family)
LMNEEAPALFIGAYPSGAMSSEVIDLADDVFSVYPEMLEAWTVTSRIIYEYEKLVIGKD